MHTINDDLYAKIEEAKSNIGNDAVDIIAEHLHLDNIDRNNSIIKASCPFGHSDTTPSFIWNEKDHYFKCFSCGKTYGIFDYLMETQPSFNEALRKLFEVAKMDCDFSIKEDNDNFFEGYFFPPEETNTDRAIVEEYCAKRGISKETLDYMGVKQDKHGNVVFELRDLDNRLLAIKYRVSKAAKKDMPKMWWFQAKDENGKPLRCTCPSLYNMQRVDFTKPLVITEGYFDTLACVEAGYKNVVSIHGGAEDLKWIQFNFDFLEQFHDIILWFDNDKAGQDGLHKSVSRLGEYRCKIVTPQKEHEEKIKEYYHSLGVKQDIIKTDANNILLACGKEAVLSLINNAAEIPSKKLKYLMDYEPKNVKEIEKVSTGFKALDKIIYGNLFPCFTIWSGYSGCVDADTEYFNGKKWCKISDYHKGDKVLEYNIASGTSVLSEPLEYIVKPCSSMYHIGNNDFAMNLSAEHNVLWYDTKEHKPHRNMCMDLVYNANKIENTYNIKGAFLHNGKGVNVNSIEVEILTLLTLCNGKYVTKAENNILFTVPYSKRIANIIRILRRTALAEIIEDKNNNRYVFTIHFSLLESWGHWCDFSLTQLQFIASRIISFANAVGKRVVKISVKDKKVADFVQFVFSAINMMATIDEYISKKGNTRFRVTIYIDKEYYKVLVKKGSSIIAFQPKNKLKYCFTMPLGTLILRKNGRIFCTYNSGKSSLANIACLISPVEYDYKVFVYSGELDNGQLSDWIFSPLAGRNHTLKYTYNNERPFYVVAKEALKCIRDFYRTKFILYDDEDGLDTSGESILQEMENAYRKYGCRVFLIDNLMTLSFEQTTEDSRWEIQKKFIKKLMGLTKKYDINVNLIVHPKKPAQGTTEHSVYDLHGASEIGNLCHRLIWVDKLKDDEEGYNTLISIVKDRPTQAAGKECKLYYDYATRRLYSDLAERNRQYEWEKHYTINYSPELDVLRLCNEKDNLCDQF